MTNAPMLTMICPIAQAIDRLAARLNPIRTETVDIIGSAGRFLACDLLADRDHPACDVSAMDGYAIRVSDYKHDKCFRIAGQCSAGLPPVELPLDQVAKIFTGAPLPKNADTVLERELATSDNASQVQFSLASQALQAWRGVRRQGENIRAGEIVLTASTLVQAMQLSSMASFARNPITVHRKLRVSVISTGSELLEAGASVQPWQIRDSNSPMLSSMLSALPFVDLMSVQRVADSKEELQAAVDRAIAVSDTVLLTGGVSVGDYDYVPEVLKQAGVETIFHRLPMRPGKPVFGGVGPDGQLVCGLPGNPVSVAVTARRIAIPLMYRLAGGSFDYLNGNAMQVPLTNVSHDLPLVWYRLVSRQSDGACTLIDNLGSGDLVSLGMSDGFVEVSPFAPSANGSYRFFTWAM